jgi:hypothetical protein
MAKRQGAEGDRGCSCGTWLALWEKQLTVNMGVHMFNSRGSTSSQHPCGTIDKEGCATASESTSREAALHIKTPMWVRRRQLANWEHARGGGARNGCRVISTVAARGSLP